MVSLIGTGRTLDKASPLGEKLSEKVPKALFLTDVGHRRRRQRQKGRALYRTLANSKNGTTSGPVSFSDTNNNHAPLLWGVAEAH